MERAGMTDEERQYVRRAYKLLYRKGYRLHYALAKIEDTLGSVSPHALHIVRFIRESKRGICPHHRRGAPRK
jgi:UDP-N-acetylglucosamine acyltransferase